MALTGRALVAVPGGASPQLTGERGSHRVPSLIETAGPHPAVFCDPQPLDVLL
ncbi:hypothetical protein BJY27_008537 [Streptomyces rapamycinicus]|uniref:Uncharacterized protein n=2 Tax=Streptomyces rapamycinicus TaxID=1226757 RepID=A0A3L8QWX0_STRRN|nr:hypothetical protein [Streptomyces rapamycinicus]RLV71834.1 hypothetical protein D3C57_144945 [Streptomyces rapamycinicus NRRL 5491]